MLERKDAYSILGVKEGASRDEIIKRFDILLKIHRATVIEADDKSNAEYNLNKINEAYNLLMGYKQDGEEKLRELEKEPSKNPILRKFNLNESKLNNYVYYYKYHVIISIIVIIILAASLKSCIDRVQPDLSLAFMGDYYSSEADTGLLENKIKSSIPLIKEISTQVVSLSDKEDGQMAYAMQMKAVTLIAAGDIDVFIMDSVNFDKYAAQGAFMSLDDIAKPNSSHKAYKLKSEDNQIEHIYGIDATGSNIISEDSFKGKELIIAIGVKTKHLDAAKKLVNLLVN